MKKINNLIVIVFLASYMLFPVDFIPDFVPGVGQLDEIVIAVIMYILWDKGDENSDIDSENT